MGRFLLRRRVANVTVFNMQAHWRPGKNLASAARFSERILACDTCNPAPKAYPPAKKSNLQYSKQIQNAEVTTPGPDHYSSRISASPAINNAQTYSGSCDGKPHMGARRSDGVTRSSRPARYSRPRTADASGASCVADQRRRTRPSDQRAARHMCVAAQSTKALGRGARRPPKRRLWVQARI